MDSRSVRVAIERDALQQALSLQEELQTLVDTATALRLGVADVSRIANDVSLVVHTSVVTVTPTTNNTVSEQDALLKEEMRLAATLSDAFREQEDARARAETVSAFLEKFDLEPHHAALLDHYDFENIEQDGMHILEALDRVRTIRQQLSTLDVFQEDQRLGATSAIRMMEALAAKQERAYERIYHWLQHHLYLNSQQQ